MRETTHTIEVAASADDVYQALADVGNWPRLFPPTVHIDVVEHRRGNEVIRVWATANGDVKTWTSRRVLDETTRRIDFRQQVCASPVAAMGGAWIVEPLSASRSRVTLLHDFRSIDDDPADEDWIERAVNNNSEAELVAMKANVEAARAEGEQLVFSFEDSVDLTGSRDEAYRFIEEADAWTERLPHVSRVALSNPASGVQRLEMDTRANDGSTHTTASIRICFPYDRIVYKQVTLPSLLSAHSGCWTFEDRGGAVRVTSSHTVAIKPAAVHLLGPDATVASARTYVRDALSANSSATLLLTKQHVESSR